MKKKITLPYLLLFLATGLAIFFIFRTNSLQRKLNKSEVGQTEIEAKLTDYQELLSIDSILIEGNYGKALNSYTKYLETNELQDKSVPLRIALVEKFMSLKSTNMRKNTVTKNVDSLETPSPVTPQQINAYDSINFALEKAKVQLKGMRRQLQQKSFGEYLTFKSKKESQMHYVGQVKNKMANGTGIALLDTGSRYEGEWKDNQRYGEGTFYWPDGEKYVGSYVNDKRNGMGTYFWPNGEKYVGQWVNDKRNGAGTFYGKDGEIVTKGLWKNDKLVEESIAKAEREKR